MFLRFWIPPGKKAGEGKENEDFFTDPDEVMHVYFSGRRSKRRRPGRASSSTCRKKAGQAPTRSEGVGGKDHIKREENSRETNAVVDPACACAIDAKTLINSPVAITGLVSEENGDSKWEEPCSPESGGNQDLDQALPECEKTSAAEKERCIPSSIVQKDLALDPASAEISSSCFLVSPSPASSPSSKSRQTDRSEINEICLDDDVLLLSMMEEQEDIEAIYENLARQEASSSGKVDCNNEATPSTPINAREWPAFLAFDDLEEEAGKESDLLTTEEDGCSMNKEMPKGPDEMETTGAVAPEKIPALSPYVSLHTGNSLQGSKGNGDKVCLTPVGRSERNTSSMELMVKAKGQQQTFRTKRKGSSIVIVCEPASYGEDWTISSEVAPTPDVTVEGREYQCLSLEDLASPLKKKREDPGIGDSPCESDSEGVFGLQDRMAMQVKVEEQSSESGECENVVARKAERSDGIARWTVCSLQELLGQRLASFGRFWNPS